MGGVLDTRFDVVAGEVRVIPLDDGVRREAFLEQLQDSIDWDAGAFDTRLAALNVGVHGDMGKFHDVS